MTSATGKGAGRIVVGIDGSAHSVKALRWAAHLAGIFGAQLVAVTAWEYPTSYGWASVPEDWNPGDDMKKVLFDTVHEVFGDKPPTGLELQVHEGSPAKVLIEASGDAALLVVGSRGHGGFAGLLLGSVSANVAEHATCPVLIIHGDHPLPPPVAARA